MVGKLFGETAGRRSMVDVCKTFGKLKTTGAIIIYDIIRIGARNHEILKQHMRWSKATEV